MFPVFLALGHKNSTLAFPHHFLLNAEIIHAMTAVVDFADITLEPSSPLLTRKAVVSEGSALLPRYFIGRPGTRRTCKSPIFRVILTTGLKAICMLCYLTLLHIVCRIHACQSHIIRKPSLVYSHYQFIEQLVNNHIHQDNEMKIKQIPPHYVPSPPPISP